MKWRHAFLLFILAALFLLPQLFWGKLYMVGGDDSRLYYLFPKQYLENFSFKVIANNTLGGNMGYFPVSYSAPILAIVFYVRNNSHAWFFVYASSLAGAHTKFFSHWVYLFYHCSVILRFFSFYS